MSTFRINKRPHDDQKPPKIVEVELVLSSYGSSSDGCPAITNYCITEQEVEQEFDRVISEIKKQKAKAIAILRKSKDAHS